MFNRRGRIRPVSIGLPELVGWSDRGNVQCQVLDGRVGFDEGYMTDIAAKYIAVGDYLECVEMREAYSIILFRHVFDEFQVSD